MEWLYSIIGGVIGGLFTFLGVKMTLKHDKAKEIRELRRKAIEERPRLEIVNHTNCTKEQEYTNDECDCSVLVLDILDHSDIDGMFYFKYDDNLLNLDNLSFIEYTLKNTGKTEIYDISISTDNPKYRAICPLEKRELYLKKGYLRYDVCADKRYIKPGEEIKIRVYFRLNADHELHPGFNLNVWINDINSRFWIQVLNCNNNTIENSELSSLKEFKAYTDIDKAIECFKKPYLW